MIAIYLRRSYELAASDVTGSYCRDIPDGTSILWLEKDSTYRKIYIIPSKLSNDTNFLFYIPPDTLTSIGQWKIWYDLKTKSYDISFYDWNTHGYKDFRYNCDNCSVNSAVLGRNKLLFNFDVEEMNYRKCSVLLPPSAKAKDP